MNEKTELHPNHLPDLRYALMVLEKVRDLVLPTFREEDAAHGEIAAAINGMSYIIKRTEESAASPSSKSTKEAPGLRRYYINAENGHVVETARGPWVRYVDLQCWLASSSIKEDGERADLGYMEAHGYTEDDLLHALAECSNAFPTPPAGGPAEQEWAQAMACPLHVPAFVKAALAAASSPPSPLGDTPDQQEQKR